MTVSSNSSCQTKVQSDSAPPDELDELLEDEEELDDELPEDDEELELDEGKPLDDEELELELDELLDELLEDELELDELLLPSSLPPDPPPQPVSAIPWDSNNAINNFEDLFIVMLLVSSLGRLEKEDIQLHESTLGACRT